MAGIVEAIGPYHTRKSRCFQAAELLGVSERHFHRLRDAFEANGAEGIIDKRRGRASARRAPASCPCAWRPLPVSGRPDREPG